MQTWKYVVVLDIKGNHKFKHFYTIHMVIIPTNKGANSYKMNFSTTGNWYIRVVLLNLEIKDEFGGDLIQCNFPTTLS